MDGIHTQAKDWTGKLQFTDTKSSLTSENLYGSLRRWHARLVAGG
ncbi:hypothetical protein GA0061100_12510 [Rhizobium hainanense]|uniref:Uncharacterized protein n=1 Tax=Rhizobium hainanense TaxID=52131 RepID=A0A1C3WL56_9HYPH|nr:hypothetical protein GA0061100_12510 [Rhizobium hainanense]